MNAIHFDVAAWGTGVVFWFRKILQHLTLLRHLGYSWSPGRTLKEIGTLSARRLAQKASQIARCTALYTTSKPVKATKAMGRQHSSGGSSHWKPAIMNVQLWFYLQNNKKGILFEHFSLLTELKCIHNLKNNKTSDKVQINCMLWWNATQLEIIKWLYHKKHILL